MKCPSKSKDSKLSIQFLKLSTGVLADHWLFIHPSASAQFLSSGTQVIFPDSKCTFRPLNGPKCSITTWHCRNIDQPNYSLPLGVRHRATAWWVIQSHYNWTHWSLRGTERQPHDHQTNANSTNIASLRDRPPT